MVGLLAQGVVLYVDRRGYAGVDRPDGATHIGAPVGNGGEACEHILAPRVAHLVDHSIRQHLVEKYRIGQRRAPRISLAGTVGQIDVLGKQRERHGVAVAARHVGHQKGSALTTLCGQRTQQRVESLAPRRRRQRLVERGMVAFGNTFRIGVALRGTSRERSCRKQRNQSLHIRDTFSIIDNMLFSSASANMYSSLPPPMSMSAQRQRMGLG